MDDKTYEKLLGVRSGFFMGDKYRLDLRWSKTSYEKEGICNLHEAVFSGPALSFAEKITDNNNISLDFCKQYFILARNIYVGKLSWGSVEYLKDNIVKLHNCKITHDIDLNRVPSLHDTDKLVIDTSGHDAEVHAFNPVYISYVVDHDWSVYNFNIKG